MLADPQLAATLRTLPRISVHGPWYRTLAFDHLQAPPPGAAPGSPIQPLWPGGAALRGARFTPQATAALTASFDCLYIASDVDTALAEVTRVLRPSGSKVPLLFEPQALMTVDGVLTNVVDLTGRGAQRSLQINRQTLTGDWILQQQDYLAGLGPMPDTQHLGDVTNGLGNIAALKFPSAKNPRGFCLVVFAAALTGTASYVELFNPTGALQQRLP